MSDIERVLDECLDRMTSEGVSVESLLILYPDQATELRPLLEAAMRFQTGSMVSPAPGFAAEARTRLVRQLATSQQTRPVSLRPAWWLAIAISSLALFALVSTTAFAQTALPGQVLYDWKLGSEVAWRTLSPDPVGVDLTLAHRRAKELSVVAHDPARFGEARDEFHQVLDRLAAERDPQNAEAIDNALQAHQKQLEKEGIKDSKLDDMVQGRGPKSK